MSRVWLFAAVLLLACTVTGVPLRISGLPQDTAKVTAVVGSDLSDGSAEVKGLSADGQPLTLQISGLSGFPWGQVSSFESMFRFLPDGPEERIAFYSAAGQLVGVVARNCRPRATVIPGVTILAGSARSSGLWLETASRGKVLLPEGQTTSIEIGGRQWFVHPIEVRYRTEPSSQRLSVEQPEFSCDFYAFLR